MVVDFWADWCGPCKQLTPALERAAAARAGKVELAKVDVDANQQPPGRFRIQGIPAVKAFQDGRVAAEFTGALPPAEVERFFDALVPSEADELARERRRGRAAPRARARPAPRDGAARARQAAAAARRHRRGAASCSRAPRGDFVADGPRSPARELAGDAAASTPAVRGLGRGRPRARRSRAPGGARREGDPERRDLIRRVMVAIFTELGPDHPLAREHRRRLSAALN